MFKDYFTKLLEDDLRAIVKPQYVDQIPKSIRGPNKTVESLISTRATLDNFKEVCDTLGAFPSPPITHPVIDNPAD